MTEHLLNRTQPKEMLSEQEGTILQQGTILQGGPHPDITSTVDETFFSTFASNVQAHDVAAAVHKSKLIFLAFAASFQIILYLIYWVAIDQFFDRYLLFLLYVPFIFYYCFPTRKRVFLLAYAAISAFKISLFIRMTEHEFYWVAFSALLIETFFLFFLIF